SNAGYLLNFRHSAKHFTSAHHIPRLLAAGESTLLTDLAPLEKPSWSYVLFNSIRHNPNSSHCSFHLYRVIAPHCTTNCSHRVTGISFSIPVTVTRSPLR